MTKDKKEALVKYQANIKQRLTDRLPLKHEGHPETYQAFLTRELRIVTAQLDAEKLEMTK